VESEEKKRLGGGEKKRRGDAWRHFASRKSVEMLGSYIDGIGLIVYRKVLYH